MEQTRFAKQKEMLRAVVLAGGAMDMDIAQKAVRMPFPLSRAGGSRH